MHPHLLRIAAVLMILAVAGCTASPWSNRKPMGLLGRSAAKRSETPAPTVAANQQDPQRMQEVMDELRQLGSVDPAAQDKLMEDLRKSDPSMWPLVLQQFKATEAYRRRTATERLAATTSNFSTSQRLPQTNDVALAPVLPPQNVYQQTNAEPFEAPVPTIPIANTIPIATSSEVTQVSYTAPMAANSGTDQLADAIALLEAEMPKNPTTQSDVAKHARLRLLYAAAGRREDALRPIPTATPAMQEFLAKQIEGLDLWLNTEQSADVSARAVEARASLAAALDKLSEMTPLDVRHLAFCTEVQSYGCIKRFDKYEFQPAQEVLLYAEIENFSAEHSPEGYHTAIQSSYEIMDASGRSIAELTFAPTEECCENLRHDYFIGYHVRMPKSMPPGKYTLRLSIEDLKSQKIGRATIDFEAIASTTCESTQPASSNSESPKTP